MTFRALFIGLVLGVFIAAFGYFNDWILRQAYVASDLVPVSVYGLLLLGLMLANPLLRLIRLRPFTAGEWCVIVSLMLVACVIPGAGLMWNFSNTVVMPQGDVVNRPEWNDPNLVDFVPDAMLVDPGKTPEQREQVVGGFKGALGGRGKWIGIDQVPWWAWTKTLSFWLPLLGLSFIAGICLVLVLHSQWAHRERLRYPIAEFASELVRGSGEEGKDSIFRDRRFWMGFGAAFVVLMINGYYQWNNSSIEIPLTVDLTSLGNKWPILSNVPLSWRYFRPPFSFAIVAIAFFVSTDVSLSLGLSNVIFSIVFLVLLKAGINFTGTFVGGGLQSYQLFGSYLGIGLILAYIGRRYYWSVLCRTVGIRKGDEVSPGIVWASRIAVLACAAMVLMMVFALKMDWMLAIICVLLLGLLFTVITRLNVETGMFFIQPTWYPITVIAGFFGIAALGPRLLIIPAILSMVLTIDPRVCVMPLAANALRFSESSGIRPGQISRWMIIAILLALVGGVLVTVYVQYNFAVGDVYEWPNTASRFPFEMLKGELPRYEGNVSVPQGLDWSAIQPKAGFLPAVSIGLVLVLICSALRLRFTWWPIHPVLFLVWGTFPLGIIGPSFMLGWLLKVVITRLGGSKSYRKAKSVFIGMIAGEFLVGILWSIIGLIYYFRMGVPGPQFRVHL